MAAARGRLLSFDNIKSFSTILIWVIGIIFGAGMVYNKVIKVDEATKSQEGYIYQIRDSQARMTEAIERMEKQSKEFNQRIFDEIAKVNEKISGAEERIIRHDILIEGIVKDLDKIKSEKGR